MLKKIALAATGAVAVHGSAHAGESSKAELYATLSASFDLYDAKCPGKITPAFIFVVAMNEDKFTAKQKSKALGQQNAVIKYVGLSSCCNLLDGQMALMDKKVSEASK